MTVLPWAEDDAQEDNNDPWHLAIINCQINRNVRPYLNRKQNVPTKPTTCITSTGALAKSTKLVLITADIECGMPHTRPGKICLPNPRPSQKLMVHELVHIWQRSDPVQWNIWLYQTWQCFPITTPDAHTRDSLMERFNPDTFYAGWYAYRHRKKCILPLPILKSETSRITDTDVKFFSNFRRNNWGHPEITPQTEITPGSPFAPGIPTWLRGHQLEHPFETAAYIIARWYEDAQPPQPHGSLIHTITPENIQRQIGLLAADNNSFSDFSDSPWGEDIERCSI